MPGEPLDRSSCQLFYRGGRPTKDTELPGKSKNVLTTPSEGKDSEQMELLHFSWECQMIQIFGKHTSRYM